jgi:hypothetical protein
MRTDLYHVISGTTEDRFGETDSLEDAVRIARVVARESQAGEPVSIEYRGKVIRQFVLMPGGKIAEEEID